MSVMKGKSPATPCPACGGPMTPRASRGPARGRYYEVCSCGYVWLDSSFAALALQPEPSSD